MKQSLFSIVLVAILCGVVYATPVSVGKRNEEMHQQLTEPELAKSEPYDSGSRGKRDLVEKQRGIANEIYPASEIANSDYADAAELASSRPGGAGRGKRDLVEKQRGIANEVYPSSEIANSDNADAAELVNSRPGGAGRGIRGLVEKQRGRGGGGLGKREAARPERGKLFENE